MSRRIGTSSLSADINGEATSNVPKRMKSVCGGRCEIRSMPKPASERCNPYASPREIEPASDWSWLMLVVQVALFLACATTIAVLYPLFFLLGLRRDPPTATDYVILLTWGLAASSSANLIVRFFGW